VEIFLFNIKEISSQITAENKMGRFIELFHGRRRHHCVAKQNPQIPHMHIGWLVDAYHFVTTSPFRNCLHLPTTHPMRMCGFRGFC
jgi:hypothetical protein